MKLSGKNGVFLDALESIDRRLMRKARKQGKLKCWEPIGRQGGVKVEFDVEFMKQMTDKMGKYFAEVDRMCKEMYMAMAKKKARVR